MHHYFWKHPYQRLQPKIECWLGTWCPFQAWANISDKIPTSQVPSMGLVYIPYTPWLIYMAYIWLILMVHVGRYTTHGSYGNGACLSTRKKKLRSRKPSFPENGTSYAYVVLCENTISRKSSSCWGMVATLSEYLCLNPRTKLEKFYLQPSVIQILKLKIEKKHMAVQHSP